MAVGDVYSIHLESIAAGGDALGRLEGGLPVFVRGGAPSETVLCRITEQRGSWARGELLEISSPSPFRVKADCSFYGLCGGCNLLHIDYEAQIEAKVSILKDTLSRTGGIAAPILKVFKSQPLGYRNRTQFHCIRENALPKTPMPKARAQKQAAKFGLMGRMSETIVAVNDCPVADLGIRELLRAGGKDIPLPIEKDRFTVFSYKGQLLSEGANERGKITLLEKEIALDTKVFFQSNIVMLEKLIMEIREIAKNSNQDLPMADLYCGVGTFAIFLCDLFPKVYLAEENKSSVSLARENLKGKNVEFFALRDNDWPKALFTKQNAFGFAVADPPRAGLCAKLSDALAKEGPPALAYISCDAASLARDAKILVSGGYVLKELSMFDFYPQTAHIETLALFVKD
jgi:23S rRNA (uracil1939-C5)-methyltransferase